MSGSQHPAITSSRAVGAGRSVATPSNGWSTNTWRPLGATCPSLRSKHVTPHVLRHTTAVELLRAGNDATIVALYLGHESVATTQIYIDADLEVKERALARTAPPGIRRGRFRPGDPLLAYLSTL